MGLKWDEEPVRTTNPFWEWWEHTPNIFWGVVAFLVSLGLIYVGVLMLFS